MKGLAEPIPSYDVVCDACGAVYGDNQACACVWRREHYRLMRELRILDARPTQSADIRRYRRELVADIKGRGAGRT